VEYIKKVSGLDVEISPVRRLLDITFDTISEEEDFKALMTSKGRKDRRKYFQLLNIAKRYAKINGRYVYDKDGNMSIEIHPSDIRRAGRLFARSAASLSENFDLSLLGISQIDQKVLRCIIENPGLTLLQVRKKLRLTDDKYESTVHSSISTLMKLKKIHDLDGQYYPDRMDTDGSSFVESNEDGEEASPTSSSPPQSIDDYEPAVEVVMTHMKCDETVASVIADCWVSMQNEGKELPAPIFADRVYAGSRGQVDKEMAIEAYQVLKEAGFR